MAGSLGESATYLAKVVRQLVKAGILRAERGASGGVRMGRAPVEITLLDIVEACQGKIAADHCRSDCARGTVCAYHRAAVELQSSIVRVLSHWTLAQLLSEAASPNASSNKDWIAACMLERRHPALAPAAGAPT